MGLQPLWNFTGFIWTLNAATCWLTDTVEVHSEQMSGISWGSMRSLRAWARRVWDSALDFNWDGLLTRGLIRDPHNWFEPFRGRTRLGVLKRQSIQKLCAHSHSSLVIGLFYMRRHLRLGLGVRKKRFEIFTSLQMHQYSVLSLNLLEDKQKSA